MDPEDDDPACQTQSSVEKHRQCSITTSTSRRRSRESDDQDLITTLAGSARSNSEQADALLHLAQGLLQSRQGNRQLRTFTDYIYESMVSLPKEVQVFCRREMYQVLEKYQEEAGTIRKTPPQSNDQRPGCSKDTVLREEGYCHPAPNQWPTQPSRPGDFEILNLAKPPSPTPPQTTPTDRTPNNVSLPSDSSLINLSLKSLDFSDQQQILDLPVAQEQQDEPQPRLEEHLTYHSL